MENGINLKYFKMVDTGSDKKKDNSSPRQYSQEDINRALIDLENGMSQRKVSAKHGIPRSTLSKRIRDHENQQTKYLPSNNSLLHGEEVFLAEQLSSLGDSGLVFNLLDLCIFIRDYLNRMCRHIPLFKDNMPDKVWAREFLDRHTNILSYDHCQNIYRDWEDVREKDISNYLSILGKSLEGVPPGNIINYDEINIADDPKDKLPFLQKRTRHTESNMSSTKSSTSIIFACTPLGEVLAPYVVYKAEHLNDSWLTSGPINVKYNRTSSGWFDSDVFVDWIKKVVIPYVSRLPREEMKVLIGDNLPGHVSFEVFKLFADNNIRMVFLPPNSTHLLHPLDVAVYGALKLEWRNIMVEWKKRAGRSMNLLPNWGLSYLLLELMIAMKDKWTELCASGFRSCGIHPLNLELVSKVKIDDNQACSSSPNIKLEEECESSIKNQACPSSPNIKLEKECESSIKNKRSSIEKNMSPVVYISNGDLEECFQSCKKRAKRV